MFAISLLAGAVNALKWIHRQQPGLVNQTDSKGAPPLALAQCKTSRAFLMGKTEADHGSTSKSGTNNKDNHGSKTAHESQTENEHNEQHIRGWDIPRAYGHRRRPFSGKAKKSQMQAKRASKSTNSGDKAKDDGDPRGQQTGTKLISAFGETQLRGEMLHTLLEQESERSLEERRKVWHRSCNI